ncbi:glutathione S-transferase family protein [Sulfitobacter guttiformis]|uniref:Glutathione S-transferase n=1 Tax=Sulfitobacter guttiformis TaxID=74349 RepID=A0A420DUB5_9RHOB|nr:glutathione S-transferase [Sulfitobacter guttiformis]KIN71292.1 Glutathione S-transferase family protein [Sulfitobacter guttiformis KCTC 32187]RKE97748.1 glutathione S-transferase [Sulfitobacter guttiformis]
MIKLHHLNRSRSLRILWLLEEIGNPYEFITHIRDEKTNLAPPELLALHPLGKSPMIELDGEIVIESGAITEFLCTTFAPQMIPTKGTPAHNRHLEAMHFAEGSAMTPILLNLYVGRLGEAGAPLHPRIQSELDNHFSYMESILRPSGHFVLDDLSAADIMLSFPAQIAMRLERRGKYPKLAAFVDAIEARPAFQRAVEKGGV